MTAIANEGFTRNDYVLFVSSHIIYVLNLLISYLSEQVMNSIN